MKNVRVLKIIVSLLLLFIFSTLVLNSIKFYKSVSYEENSILMTSLFILGAFLALILRSGIVFVFWYSYNMRYANYSGEHETLKKVLASFLFFSIISVLPLFNESIFIIFIICTLIMRIRKLQMN